MKDPYVWIHPIDSHLSRTCHYQCRQIITGEVLGATIHPQTRFFSVCSCLVNRSSPSNQIGFPAFSPLCKSAVLPHVTCSGAVKKHSRCHFVSLSGTAGQPCTLSVPKCKIFYFILHRA
ncbi:hypothetical protein VPH35_139463 [Triticum aestivum]